MKKFLSFLLALMMVLSLVVTMVACQDHEQPNDDKPSTDTPGTTDKPGTDTPGTDDPDKDDPQEPDDPQMPEERIPLNYLPTEGFDGASWHSGADFICGAGGIYTKCCPCGDFADPYDDGNAL